MERYSENFDRSSEAICRTALDFIFNECLTVMVSHVDPLTGMISTVSNLRKTIPSQNIRGLISALHTLLLRSTLSECLAKFLFLTRLTTYQHLATLALSSMAAWTMASVESLSQHPATIVNAVFSRCYSLLKPRRC
jgi:hypothetical protein